MTSIEWTDKTWNPVTGCDRVSPGCKHCYALDLAARLKSMGQPRYQKDGQPPTSGPGSLDVRQAAEEGGEAEASTNPVPRQAKSKDDG